MKCLSLATQAYIAGIVDGEGCISISKASVPKGGKSPDYMCRIQVTNTNKKLGIWLRKKTGIGSITVSVQSNDRWNTRYDWTITRKQCPGFLLQIYPYLVLKKEEADIMLRFRSTFNKAKPYFIVPKVILSMREKLYLQLKKRHDS